MYLKPQLLLHLQQQHVLELTTLHTQQLCHHDTKHRSHHQNGTYAKPYAGYPLIFRGLTYQGNHTQVMLSVSDSSKTEDTPATSLLK